MQEQIQTNTNTIFIADDYISDSTMEKDTGLLIDLFT